MKIKQTRKMNCEQDKFSKFVTVISIFRRRHFYPLSHLPHVNKGNNKITELRTILQRESQNS
jgi:hypothetical protein